MILSSALQFVGLLLVMVAGGMWIKNEPIGTVVSLAAGYAFLETGRRYDER